MDLEKLREHIETLQDYLDMHDPSTQDYQKALRALVTLQKMENELLESRTRVDNMEDDLKLKNKEAEFKRDLAMGEAELKAKHESNSKIATWVGLGATVLGVAGTIGAALLSARSNQRNLDKIIEAEHDPEDPMIIPQKTLGFIKK